MNPETLPPDARIPEGAIIDYQLYDEQAKPCICGLTRDEAREHRAHAGGYVCKVVVVH